MTKPTKVIVDCSTGEQSIIELTDEEIAQLEADKARFEAEQAEREAEASAKTEAKAALLDRLGITAEEAQLLLA